MIRRHFLALFSLWGLAACLRPQDPVVRPYPHRALVVEGPAGPLAGELVLPAGEGPFPAVLLVAGSGPQSRDEEVAGHRPFLVLSDFLAKAGYASFRYDKRGVGQSGGDFATATISDFAEDAGAAFDVLAAMPEIDNGRIAMLGHSEGGLTAPLAARGRNVAALVLLAGPGVPIDALLRLQTRTIATLHGAIPSEIESLDKALDGAFTALRAAPDLDAARLDLAQAFAPLPPPERANLEGLIATPWCFDALRHDPLTLIRAFSGPVLALYGGTDTQVDATINAAALRSLGPRLGLHVEIMPGLNHLFQPDPSGDPSKYGRIDITMAPEAVRRVVDFLKMALRPRTH